MLEVSDQPVNQRLNQLRVVLIQKDVDAYLFKASHDQANEERIEVV